MIRTIPPTTATLVTVATAGSQWSGPPWTVNLPETWILWSILPPAPPTLAPTRDAGRHHAPHLLHWLLIELLVRKALVVTRKTIMGKKYIFFGPIVPSHLDDVQRGPNWRKYRDGVIHGTSGVPGYMLRVLNAVDKDRLRYPNYAMSVRDVRRQLEADLCPYDEKEPRFLLQVLESMTKRGLTARSDNAGFAAIPQLRDTWDTTYPNVLWALEHFAACVENDPETARSWLRASGALSMIVASDHKPFRDQLRILHGKPQLPEAQPSGPRRHEVEFALRDTFRDTFEAALEEDEGLGLLDGLEYLDHAAVGFSDYDDAFGGFSDGGAGGGDGGDGGG